MMPLRWRCKKPAVWISESLNGYRRRRALFDAGLPVCDVAAIGLFISNTATAVLMAPIALAAGKTMGVSPIRLRWLLHGGFCGLYDAGPSR
ncbi:hypothetical protein ACNKHO_14580 [Shigella flexneri]